MHIVAINKLTEVIVRESVAQDNKAAAPQQPEALRQPELLQVVAEREGEAGVVHKILPETRVRRIVVRVRLIELLVHLYV